MPAEVPDISVVVVNWNCRELLVKRLESLSLQTHPNYEVIVVDNGSNHGSAEMVRILHSPIQYLCGLS